MNDPRPGDDVPLANSCARCGRPVTVSTGRCLYCGAARAPSTPPPSTPSPDQVAARSPDPGAEPGRVVLVADLQDVDPRKLRGALGLSAYEAGQRARGPRYQFLRLANARTAEEEAAQLSARGLPVVAVPEGEARAGLRPRVALGGECRDGVLRTRTNGGDVRTSAGNLLMVVRGPITREYQARGGEGLAHVKRIRTASLEGGFRFHLWHRDAEHPLELDPGSFAFGRDAVLPGSSLLLLTEWIAAVAALPSTDDSFRRLPPALAPAAPDSGGVLAAANVLARPADSRGAKSEGPVILDNLAQFRFYSGWRAAVERRRPR